MDVRGSMERWSDIRLSNGTILRAKVVVFSATRFDGQHEPDRSLTYQASGRANVSVVDAPNELKSGVQWNCVR